MAEHHGWSPILVRILYIILPFAGIPLYVVLWVVIPEAQAEEQDSQ